MVCVVDRKSQLNWGFFFFFFVFSLSNSLVDVISKLVQSNAKDCSFFFFFFFLI